MRRFSENVIYILNESLTEIASFVHDSIIAFVSLFNSFKSIFVLLNNSFSFSFLACFKDSST